MKSLYAFTKKEIMDQLRSNKVLVLGIIFIIFGIMNPAIAKLTPWLFEKMSDSLAESGIQVGKVTVDALMSWEQFFKNIPMGLIAFVLLESSIFTKEYQSGTLVLSLTKGLKRHNVVIAKTVVLVLLWTVCFWMCFGITYVYNDFYWDNSIADNLMFSSFCWWFFGIWVIMIMVLSSTLAQNGSGVLLGTGGVVFAIYLISMTPKVDKYMETMLTTGYSLTTGASKTSDYTVAVIVTLIVSVVFFVTGIIVFNKKRL